METNNNKEIAGAIIVAGLLIAGAIMLKGNSSNSPTIDRNVANIEARVVSEDDHILGNKDAKVVIIEYSDTECPYCKVFHNTLHNIVDGNEEVAWVYRHYPIPELHKKAFYEANATDRKSVV